MAAHRYGSIHCDCKADVLGAEEGWPSAWLMLLISSSRSKRQPVGGAICTTHHSLTQTEQEEERERVPYTHPWVVKMCTWLGHLSAVTMHQGNSASPTTTQGRTSISRICNDTLQWFDFLSCKLTATSWSTCYLRPVRVGTSTFLTFDSEDSFSSRMSLAFSCLYPMVVDWIGSCSEFDPKSPVSEKQRGRPSHFLT